VSAPAATRTVDLKQAIVVGVFAGLIVVALVLVLDRVQVHSMWREVHDTLDNASNGNGGSDERDQFPAGEDDGRGAGRPEPGADPGQPGAI
jgi:hypothetical protein